MNFQEIYALSDWINSQKDVSWLNVTLEIKGKRSYPQPLLKDCVRDFLRRLDGAVVTTPPAGMEKRAKGAGAWR